MNEMHGPEAARAIRATGFTGFIVGVTGNVNDCDVNEYLCAGANFVLAKPPRIHDLQVIFREVFVNRTRGKRFWRVKDF